MNPEEIKALYGHPPSVALRNRLLAEIERLQMEIRIPVIPHGAQRRLDRAEQRVRELEEALREIAGHPGTRRPLSHLARAALGEPEK